ncbi:MAG: adenosylmethionine--8-amino-7-oxononanoate transaminase [Candidatus Omnitrophota bacterium]
MRNSLVSKDLEYIWHPYTQMKDCEDLPPVAIKRGEGAKLYDHEGNFYYDTISSWWCNVHGHNHPFIKQAVKEQIDRLEHVLFAGFTHEPAVKLAEKLIRMAPGELTKVFYSDNGSTSVEVALKMSTQYWANSGIPDKKKFLSLDLGYHGDTIGAMSVSGLGLFNRQFEHLFFQGYKAPSPYCYRCPCKKRPDTCGLECLAKAEAILKKNHNEISGIIIEPLLLGAGGMIVYPVSYLEGISGLAEKYDVHLILDEVATGFGRTGKMFACEHAEGISPDFLCLSKGLTSGYLPLGATLTTGEIYNAFYGDHSERKTFYHGHTFTANPVACAAASASIDLFKKENTLERAAEINSQIAIFLKSFSDCPIAGDTRHTGAVGAIELVKDRKTKEAFNFEERIGSGIYKAGLMKNLILRPLGNILYLFLPLCVKDEELTDIFEKTAEILRSESKKFRI